MKACELRIGDRVRITAIPGEGVPNYTLHRETRQVYQKIIARKRSVRISEIDEDGQPWYTVKFRRKNGKWEEHVLNIMDSDTNWVPVKRKVK